MKIMLKRVLRACLFSLVAGSCLGSHSISYASTADTFVLHKGLPETGTPPPVYIYKGKINIEDKYHNFRISRTFKSAGQENFNGQQAERFDTTTKTRVKSMRHYDKDEEARFFICNDSGCQYLGSNGPDEEYSNPDETFTVPYSARIGDSGKVGTYVGKDNKAVTCKWSLDAAEKDLATLTTTCTYIEDGEVSTVETFRMVIDHNGACQSVTFDAQDIDEDESQATRGRKVCPEDKYFLRLH